MRFVARRRRPSTSGTHFDDPAGSPVLPVLRGRSEASLSPPRFFSWTSLLATPDVPVAKRFPAGPERSSGCALVTRCGVLVRRIGFSGDTKRFRPERYCGIASSGGTRPLYLHADREFREFRTGNRGYRYAPLPCTSHIGWYTMESRLQGSYSLSHNAVWYTKWSPGYRMVVESSSSSGDLFYVLF